jgi:hypothetical protein
MENHKIHFISKNSLLIGLQKDNARPQSHFNSCVKWKKDEYLNRKEPSHTPLTCVKRGVASATYSLCTYNFHLQPPHGVRW